MILYMIAQNMPWYQPLTDLDLLPWYSVFSWLEQLSQCTKFMDSSWKKTTTKKIQPGKNVLCYELHPREHQAGEFACYLQKQKKKRQITRESSV